MSLGIPYMGSKRKLAKPIIDYIVQNNPNARYFYDLFGGGGAISFEALQRPQFETVTYNELNTGVVELLRKIIKDGVTDEFYQWVDRETFNKHKADDDWFGGLCKVIWSFGNNQSTYIFGKTVENYKRLGHLAVVDKCRGALSYFGIEPAHNYDRMSINDRRLFFGAQIRKIKRFDLQQLEHLQRLQHLERLQQLQKLERLQITNDNALDFELKTEPEHSLIYLDPPYIKTQEYQIAVDYDKLYEFVAHQKCKVYLSSYESPMHLVKDFFHRSTLSATTNNKVIERLYCNIKENDASQLF